jgi:4a-hydroxytetrahydrobiopterin dehydratase
MSDAETLSDEEVDEALKEFDIWGVHDGKLATEIEFEGFRDAVFFANAVFSLAEEEFHHPEVMVTYGRVQIDIYSHEADGITEKDINMADRIEQKLASIDWS